MLEREPWRPEDPEGEGGIAVEGGDHQEGDAVPASPEMQQQAIADLEARIQQQKERIIALERAGADLDGWEIQECYDEITFLETTLEGVREGNPTVITHHLNKMKREEK